MTQIGHHCQIRDGPSFLFLDPLLQRFNHFARLFKRGGVGIAQRASVAALEIGVVVQRLTFVQCFFLPTTIMHSFAAAQPTQILSSFVELRGIIVPVQLFATKFAATRVTLCWLLHLGKS
jgi:hypothetical protein